MTKKEIEKILDYYIIKNYTINNDLSVDIDENVYLDYNDFKEFPVAFRKVTGSFWCNYCSKLIS